MAIYRIFSAEFFRWLTVVTAASMGVQPIVGLVTGFNPWADAVTVLVFAVIATLPIVFGDLGIVWWDLTESRSKKKAAFDGGTWAFLLLRWLIPLVLSMAVMSMLPSVVRILSPKLHYGFLIPVGVVEAVTFLVVTAFLGSRWYFPATHDRSLLRLFPGVSDRILVNPHRRNPETF